MRLSLKAFTLFAVTATALQAGNFSFTGTFSTDDQVQLFNFSVASTTTVTLLSEGFGGGIYTGGKNVSGTVINPGGLDSAFIWFDGTGTILDSVDDDTTNTVNKYNGSYSDAYYQGSFAAGNYTLALVLHQNANIDTLLADGFAQTGNPSFSCGGSGNFCDGGGGNTTGAWAVDIIQVDTASEVTATPEPATFALIGLPLALVIASRRRNS